MFKHVGMVWLNMLNIINMLKHTIRDNDVITEACCFMNQESVKNCLNKILTPNPSTIPKTVTCVLCHAAQKKLKYGELWGLARQAAQLAIEDDNYSEMMRWLKEFIHQHKETLTRSVRSRDQDQNQDLSDNNEVDANKENEPQQAGCSASGPPDRHRSASK